MAQLKKEKRATLISSFIIDADAVLAYEFCPEYVLGCCTGAVFVPVRWFLYMGFWTATLTKLDFNG